MSECSCVYDDIDHGCYTLKDVNYRAKEDLFCCECSRIIQKGKDYNYSQIISEGTIKTYKTCLDCLSIRKSFFQCGWFYKILIDDLKYHIDEMCGRISSDCIVSLTPRAKDIVCDMIQESWVDDDD